MEHITKEQYQRFLDGDLNAQREVYRKFYYNGIYLAYGDEDIAAECTAEFFRLVNKDYTIAEAVSFFKNLIAQKSIDHLRKESLKKSLTSQFVSLDEDYHDEFAYEQDFFDFPSQDIIHLKKAITYLSKLDQKIIKLRFEKDLAIKDVAKKVKLSQNDVKGRIHRMKKRLKEIIIKLRNNEEIKINGHYGVKKA